MNIMIDDVRGQVQAIIRERERHEDAAKQELAEIERIRRRLTEQSAVLKQLVRGSMQSDE